MTVEELKPYGLEELRADERTALLESQSVGVLGLPAADAPYLLPLSYGYDGDDTLYFTYLLGETSRKAHLTEDASAARFLVYSVESLFNWRSVLLTGTVRSIPPSQWGDLADVLADAWRPELFQTAETERNVAIYAFDITDATGIKHTGLAEGFKE